MLASLALVILIGLLFAFFCQKIGLPRIIGMLLTGILLGPCCLNLLDGSLLGISAELRKIALIIILIKAGLSLRLSDFKTVGRPALLMSFLPACFEILAYVLLAPALLGVNRVEAAVMGAVMGAVSPAVVVPRMVELMEKKLGTSKKIPQMLLAGASLDDVFVIVLFTSFCGMAQGQTVSASVLADVPVSILLGIALGGACGRVLGLFLEARHRSGDSVRGSVKVLLILGLSFALMTVEALLEGTVPLSGLLAVMSMACMLAATCRDEVREDLSGKFGKLWLGAEILLFVLVGAAVDIRATLSAGPAALLLIVLALALRSVGVWLCMTGTPLNGRERLYCVLAYLPKATVQAAIGAVPLSLGLSCGPVVLSVAVLGILFSAPFGAICMDKTANHLLEREKA